jgi:diadenosine tetraphosphate (Ap4A) HIT family hydrolase
MTDLSTSERQQLMTVVFAVEQVVRSVMQPKKINLASLGNVVPHLHWHVIARYTDDPHFPNAIWSETQRDGISRKVDIAALRREVIAALS